MKQILHRVLSFDGGGIRGLYQAKLLEALKTAGLDVAQRADILAGTSTGAIMAAGLWIGKQPNEISELYTDLGRKVFPQRGWISRGFRSLTWLTSRDPGYSSAVLREELKKQLGQDTKLGDCTGKRLMIPAISLNQYKLKVFDSADENDKQRLLVDVVLASAGAPTYFLPVAVGNTHYVDGGLCCNNPGFRAVAKLFFREKVELNRIYLLSISTGAVPVTQAGDEFMRMRMYRWIKSTIDIAMSGSSDLAVQDGDLVGCHCRITENFGRQIDLDDYRRAVEILPALAEGKAAEVRDAVKRWFDGPERTGQNFAGTWESTYDWEGESTTDTLQIDQRGNYIVGETVGDTRWPYELSGTVDGPVCMGTWKGNLQGTFLVVMSAENHTVKGQWIGTGDAKPYFGEWSWRRKSG